VIQVPVAPIGQSVSSTGKHQWHLPRTFAQPHRQEGCSFTFNEVPRARLEVLFETGRADLLIPASKTPKRDAFGTFVALVHKPPHSFVSFVQPRDHQDAAGAAG